MNPYESMSIEELEAELSQRRAEIDLAKEELRQLVKLYDAKVAERDAAAKVAQMSDIERAALAQVIQAYGIPSAEQFGN